MADADTPTEPREDAVVDEDAADELLADGQEEVFSYTAVERGLGKDPLAMDPALLEKPATAAAGQGDTPTRDAELRGGCACGAVRFRLTSIPFEAGYCHCSICRRTTGAPVMAFATVPFNDLVLEKGAPRRRRSSSFGERWFCADCGTQIAMRVDHEPDTIDIAQAAMDDPAVVAPQFHIFFADRIAWFDTADDLPRFDQLRPGRPGERD